MSQCRWFGIGWIACVPLFGLIVFNVFPGEGVAAEPKASPAEAQSTSVAPPSGRELFNREWIANDPRSHGGDGLGPVFNETSCVGCHNQGGVGGSGAEAKNVDIVTAFRNVEATPIRARTNSIPPSDASTDGNLEDDPMQQRRRELLSELRKLHPTLTVSRSVVLHKSGTDPAYGAWRDVRTGLHLFPTFRQKAKFGTPPAPVATGRVDAVRVAATLPPASGFFNGLLEQSQQEAITELTPPGDLIAEAVRASVASMGTARPRSFPSDGGELFLLQSQRNTPALFGSGLIDSIPDAVLVELAANGQPEFPEITGRVSRLKDGRVGRFGWKAQTASLHDFTMTACAIELGLNVPDHPQSAVPYQPDYKPSGFDLNREECLALVGFLKELAPPSRRVEAVPAIAADIQQGEQTFVKVGCAACHQPDLGEVRGVFSDLLLHDMGQKSSDSGNYGSPSPGGTDGDDPLAALLAENSTEVKLQLIGRVDLLDSSREERLRDDAIGAGRQEWRTPPLWGVRDSAPYLHDGRARTLEQAIALHGGEGQLSANRFFRLKPEERTQVLSFLRSLTAPQ